MKKVLWLLGVLFLLITHVGYADKDPYGDYTLIDCIHGSDTTGSAFESGKPYKTLNNGIEASLSYLSSTVNTSANAATASGKTFMIKVNCSAMPINDTSITLDYNGYNYDNEVVIEGVGDDGLVINNISFYIKRGRGNIKFKNAKFIDNSSKGYYFKGEDRVIFGYLGSSTINSQVGFRGIKIEDSYIRLYPNTQIHGSSYYLSDTILGYGTRNANVTYYFNQQFIKNTKIDIDITGNYNFSVPYIIKDSSINFRNTTSTGSYNIAFVNRGGLRDGLDFRGFSIISSELNLGGNNFSTVNEKEIAFVNNKISNFGTFDFGASNSDPKYGKYINNYIVNSGSLDISNVPYTFNNVFEGEVNDSGDRLNLRKNFNISNIGPKGVAWILRKLNGSKYLQIDYSSSKLFKEITGQDIPDTGGQTYLIFY